jgi:hypothetical protein
MRGMIGCSALLVVLAAGVAGATPPQVVVVTDTLFAATDTHIYLLRNVEDNMGYYNITQTDVLLVARNRLTNVDDDIWPVARSVDYGFEDPVPEGRVQALPLQQVVNPFEIAASKQALLMMGRWGQPQTVETAVISVGTDAVILRDDSETYQLIFADVAARLEENLVRSRDRVPAYFLEGGFDMLIGVQFDPAADCTFTAFSRMNDSPSGQTWMADVTCENDDTLAPVSTVLVMSRQE